MRELEDWQWSEIDNILNVLASLEAQWKASPQRERDPKAARFYISIVLTEMLSLVSRMSGTDNSLLWQLVDAIKMLDGGKRHPLLALPSDPKRRPHGVPTISRFQGEAAALLERGENDEGLLQGELAGEIAVRLGRSGLVSPGKDPKPYTGRRVIDWRDECHAKIHPGTADYERLLNVMRNRNFKALDMLEAVATSCSDKLLAENEIC